MALAWFSPRNDLMCSAAADLLIPGQFCTATLVNDTAYTCPNDENKPVTVATWNALAPGVLNIGMWLKEQHPQPRSPAVPPRHSEPLRRRRRLEARQRRLLPGQSGRSVH